jgi:hypothetical protein
MKCTDKLIFYSVTYRVETLFVSVGMTTGVPGNCNELQLKQMNGILNYKSPRQLAANDCKYKPSAFQKELGIPLLL